MVPAMRLRRLTGFSQPHGRFADGSDYGIDVSSMLSSSVIAKEGNNKPVQSSPNLKGVRKILGSALASSPNAGIAWVHCSEHR